MITLKLAPPNSVLLIMDLRTGEPPTTMGKELVAATNSCVAVGTLCEVDGKTSVVFSAALESSDPVGDMKQVFDGVIATPSREVHLCTTALESVAKLPVSATTAKVRVWANHRTEPDCLLIVVNSAEPPPRAI
jgi:hypothetical protein